MRSILAMLTCWFLLIMFGPSLGNVQLRNNILFRPIKTIATSRAHWQVALIIDLQAFPMYLTQLNREVRIIHDVAERARVHYLSDNIADVSTLIKTLTDVQTYLDSFSEDYRALLTEYNQLTDFVTNRQKRSLLNLGGVFKFLFGVADNNDMNALRGNVAQLASSQKQIIHIVSKSISVLNLTRMEVAENRQTLNGLLSSLQKFQEEVTRQVNRLERLFIQLASFNEVMNALNTMSAELRQLFSQAKMFLIDFRIKMDILSLQRLTPSIITPSHLLEILKDIEDHIPNDFALPSDPNVNLWQYYTSLQCSTLFNTEHFAIIIQIPLKPVANTYQLIEAEALPVPYNTSTLRSPNLDHMPITAAIDIESQYFLINEQRSHYALLSPAIAHSCIKQTLPFCDINQGFSSTIRSGVCVIESFLNTVDERLNTCQSMVRARSVLPMARTIARDRWLIITHAHIHFTIKCLNGSISSVTISDVLSTITIPETCQAFSNELYLQLYYDESSKLSISENLPQIHHHSLNMSFAIWEPFHASLTNISTIKFPPSLRNVAQIPMATLADQIKSLAIESDLSATTPLYLQTPYLSVGLGTVALVVIIIIIIVLYKKGCFPKKFRSQSLSTGQRCINRLGEAKFAVATTGAGHHDESELTILHDNTNPGASAPTQTSLMKLYPSVDRNVINNL